MEISSEDIDDWNPSASNNTLLDKIVVSFTGI